MAMAIPKETEKMIRPTASSRATMGSSSRVRGPSALYWRTTIRVAAGAVAEAMAPRVMAASRGSTSSPRTKCSPIRAASTSREAATAWKIPMTVASLPVFFRAERRNSLPIEKAIKPRAAVLTTPTSCTAS